jgi:hypothetical protein
VLSTIKNNLPWYALSLGIALVLWVFVVGQPEMVTSQPALIFFKNLPRDLEVGSDVPDRVHIELRGPAGKLSAARLSETAVLLDLASVRSPGERTFTIGPGSLNLPAGVTLLRAVPSQLGLRFDRIMSKEVPVQVRTTGKDGLDIVRQEIVPSTLKISGPDHHVEQIDSAQTDPIDLSSVSNEGQFSVHAYVADPQVRFDSSPVVTVKVWVKRPARGQ